MQYSITYNKEKCINYSGGAGGKGTWGAPGDELFEDGHCRDEKDPNYDSESEVGILYQVCSYSSYFLAFLVLRIFGAVSLL